ncbi:hypothetical protein BJX76DRAFT_127115 [Aspergillus varians]
MVHNNDKIFPESVPAHLHDDKTHDDGDPKLIQERVRIQKDVREIIKDERTPVDTKINALSSYLTEKYEGMMAAKSESQDLDDQNERLRDQVRELNDANEHLYDEITKLHDETAECQSTIRELTGALQATQARLAASENSISAAIPHEMIERLQDTERELREKLDIRAGKISQLESNLMAAKGVIQSYQTRFGHYDRQTAGWIKDLESQAAQATLENIRLRTQVNEINRYMESFRAADAGRWDRPLQQAAQRGRHESILQQQQKQPSITRLTYGTMDSNMTDAYDADTPMTTLPERYRTPFLIRMRRRLARTKARPRRSGSSAPRTARPAECRKGYSERRAASTYLQYRDRQGKEGCDLLKPKGRNAGLSKLLPRKRSRLEKGSDMTQRIMAVSEARSLPPLPRSIKPRVSPNPYNRRDDAELAKLMGTFSMSNKGTESVAIQAESPGEAKLVTITQTVVPFIPRANTFSRVRYLPKEPRQLTSKERQKWTKVASKWELGPQMEKKKSNKQLVRFKKSPERVEYESYEPTKEWTPDQKSPQTPEWSLGWSQMIIAFLIFLLFFSNMGKPEEPKVSWKESNKRPEDIVAKIRNPAQGNGKVTIIDFEVAKWSDVDASVFG